MKTIEMKQDKAETKKQSEVKSVESLEKSVFELKTKVENYEKSFSKMGNSIEERKIYFLQKNELIKKLEVFIKTKESLNFSLDQVAEVAASNDFKTDKLAFNLEYKEYTHSSGRIMFTINNPLIIGDLIQFIISRVDTKLIEIEQKIQDL